MRQRSGNEKQRRIGVQEEGRGEEKRRGGGDEEEERRRRRGGGEEERRRGEEERRDEELEDGRWNTYIIICFKVLKLITAQILYLPCLS